MHAVPLRSLRALGITVLLASAAMADTPAPPAGGAMPGGPPPGGAMPGGPPPMRKPIDPDAPAETQFKNIKVLTGVPAGQLRDAMEFIAASLGTGCNHCHVRGSMDKDDKPTKATARKMMQMVAGLNRDVFEGKQTVTCFTCHQGRTRPVGVPSFTAAPTAPDAFVADEAPGAPGMPPGDPGMLPPPAAGAPATPPPGAAPDAAVDPAKVIARFVDAVGGRAALDAVKGLKLSGKQSGEDHEASVDMTWLPPASMVATITSEEGGRSFSFTHGTNGSAAWGRMGEDAAMDLHGVRRVEAMRDAELLPAAAFAGPAGLESGGTGKIGEQRVVLLTSHAADGVVDRLYFDASTGLLVRRAYDVPTPLGKLPYEVDYSDWRPEAGVKVPHVMVTKEAGEQGTLTLTQVAPAASLGPATFARPGAGT